MRAVFACLLRAKVCCGPGLAALLLAMIVSLPRVAAQSAPSVPTQQSAAPVPQSAEPQAAQPPAVAYDKGIFQKPIPADQLVFLSQFSGAPVRDLIRDKRYRKLMKGAIPDCMFHYGRDMPLSDALEMVLGGSTLPVEVRDGRYMLISGQNGPYLAGRGFIWIDMQDGLVVGGFYFHPTNGEPTPSVNIFSRQIVKEDYLKMSQLPPAFTADFLHWSAESRVPPLTTRYFITGSNKKILLEHNEDYCVSSDGTPAPPGSGCEQMNADAADIDMDAAYYLEQTHHVTNATAWMINGPDQAAWLQLRTSTCAGGPDPLGCRIRMTRQRTRVIVGGHPVHG